MMVFLSVRIEHGWEPHSMGILAVSFLVRSPAWTSFCS